MLKIANLGEKMGPKWAYWPKMVKNRFPYQKGKKYKYVIFFCLTTSRRPQKGKGLIIELCELNKGSPAHPQKLRVSYCAKTVHFNLLGDFCILSSQQLYELV